MSFLLPRQAALDVADAEEAGPPYRRTGRRRDRRAGCCAGALAACGCTAHDLWQSLVRPQE
eukprot:3793295-Pyramimonas_sp.AAC.1